MSHSWCESGGIGHNDTWSGGHHDSGGVHHDSGVGGCDSSGGCDSGGGGGGGTDWNQFKHKKV